MTTEFRNIKSFEEMIRTLEAMKSGDVIGFQVSEVEMEKRKGLRYRSESMELLINNIASTVEVKNPDFIQKLLTRYESNYSILSDEEARLVSMTLGKEAYSFIMRNIHNYNLIFNDVTSQMEVIKK